MQIYWELIHPGALVSEHRASYRVWGSFQRVNYWIQADRFHYRRNLRKKIMP